ncbi:MAG: hypothetical protein GNW80_17380 [Asgard group archaeon]|nr:hypothetical protein [Asgard group archaeon]
MNKTIYFEKYGTQNTDKIIEIVSERIKKGDLKTLVVASTSGETGVRFATAFQKKIDLLVVSDKEMKNEHKKKIKELGGKALDKTHLALHVEGMDKVRESYRTLGQGFKVAVEIVLIAADKNEIELFTDVISVGGTGRGADTAIIAKTTTSKEIFSSDKDKKLEIRAVLAMPLEKKWW